MHDPTNGRKIDEEIDGILRAARGNSPRRESLLLLSLSQIPPTWKLPLWRLLQVLLAGLLISVPLRLLGPVGLRLSLPLILVLLTLYATRLVLRDIRDRRSK